MPDDGRDGLEIRVAALESQIAAMCRRLFSVERRMLLTGQLLSIGDLPSSDSKDLESDVLHSFSHALGEVSTEFRLRLHVLDEEEDKCCPMHPGADQDDQHIS